MKKEEQIKNFDINGVLSKNGNLFALPFTYETANIIVIPVPWDITTSNLAGTSNGPQAILDYSPQIDFYDFDVEDAWKLGIYLLPLNEKWIEQNEKLRPLSDQYIAALESPIESSSNDKRLLEKILHTINEASLELKNDVYKKSSEIIEAGKIPFILGGEHSCPLGLIEALLEKHSSFGILQIDAHADLRNAYEGFTYSHASIFYNAMQLSGISKLVSVGIRDICEEEIKFTKAHKDKIIPFYDHQLKKKMLVGNMNWQKWCIEIVNQLPQKVYISFDIDGLSPELCPDTGTPVPGGLSYNEAIMLLKELILQEKTIIGADLSEVSVGSYPIINQSKEINANIGARILYKLCNLTGRSNHLI